MATMKKNNMRTFIMFLVLFFECYCQNSTDNYEQLLNLNNTKIQNTTTSKILKNLTTPERETNINVCCKFTKIWSAGSGCSQYNSTNIPIVPNIIENFTYTFVYYNPCKDKYSLLEIKPENNTIFTFKNGTIFQNNTGDNESNKKWNSNDGYCLANYLDDKNKISTGVLVCEWNENNNLVNENLFHALASFGTILSVPLSGAIFFIYAFIPELRNLRGFILMAYVACMFINYVVIAVDLFYGHNIIIISWNNVCIHIDFVYDFANVAKYFWSSVMCFDIWQTFRYFRLLLIKEGHKRIKLLIYSIYAWGLPLIIMIICFNLNLKNQNSLQKDLCSYEKTAEMQFIIYIPIIIIVCVNIFFFIKTALNICQQKKSIANHIKGTDSQRTDSYHKHWFNLYLKLFIVMGINISMWIIMTIFLKPIPGNFHDIIENILYSFEQFQGVIIFVIFICNKRVKKLILKRIGSRKRSSQMTATPNKKSLSQSDSTVAETRDEETKL